MMIIRGGSRTVATSKMELFVIIVNGFQPLTIIAKSTILDVATVLDLPLIMMIMMLMNCFCGMVDRRKAFSLISSREHCQRSSPSQISDTRGAGFEPEFRLSWMKMCSSDNHYTTAPQNHYTAAPQVFTK